MSNYRDNGFQYRSDKFISKLFINFAEVNIGDLISCGPNEECFIRHDDKFLFISANGQNYKCAVYGVSVQISQQTAQISPYLAHFAHLSADRQNCIVVLFLCLKILLPGSTYREIGRNIMSFARFGKY